MLGRRRSGLREKGINFHWRRKKRKTLLVEA